MRAGHRIGVLISGANSDEYRHIATRTTVTVNKATIRLPFLRYDRRSFLKGKATPRLKEYLDPEGKTELRGRTSRQSRAPSNCPPRCYPPSAGKGGRLASRGARSRDR